METVKQRLKEFEQREYVEELSGLIKPTKIVADFAKIQAKVTDIKPIAIFSAIGFYSISLLFLKFNPSTFCRLYLLDVMFFFSIKSQS